MASDVREKIDKLVALATDESTTEDEARSSALTAIRLASREGFVLMPKQDLSDIRTRVQGLMTECATLKNNEQRDLILGVVAGFLFGGGKIPL